MATIPLLWLLTTPTVACLLNGFRSIDDLALLLGFSALLTIKSEILLILIGAIKLLCTCKNCVRNQQVCLHLHRTACLHSFTCLSITLQALLLLLIILLFTGILSATVGAVNVALG